MVLIPFFVSHLTPVRPEPQNVFDARSLDRAAEKEVPPAKHRMIQAQSNDFSNQRKQVLFGLKVVPIDPADLVILAIRVVVALLRAAHRISSQDHRNSLRQQ